MISGGPFFFVQVNLFSEARILASTNPQYDKSTAVEEVLIIKKKFAKFFGPRMFIRS